MFRLLKAVEAAIPPVPLAAPTITPIQWAIFGIGTTFCVFGALLVICLRKRIRACFVQWPLSRIFVKVLSYAFAVVGVVASDWFEPWKQATWAHEPGQALMGATILGFCGAVFLLSDWATSVTESSDREEIKNLQALNLAVNNQLHGWVHLSVQISQVISAKVKRLRELASKKNITIEEFLLALNPERQFYENVYAIHQFYKRLLDETNPNAKLRLAIYRINPKDPTGLIQFVSWDGEKKGCVKVEDRHLKVVHADGARSIVAKCHNLPGNERFIVVPDCEHHPDFEYFEPGQRDYLKSMVAFKYQINIDGTVNALIIALDCNQVNFFRPETSQETKTFLVEMMKRIEYELLTSEIAGKLNPLN